MSAGGRKVGARRRGSGLPPAEKEPDSSRPDSSTIDIEEYRDELAKLKLSEELARQVLESLMGILYGFVELGVSVNLCGPLLKECGEAVQAQTSDVSWEYPDTPDSPGDEDAP